jgi:hypothetical protein
MYAHIGDRTGQDRTGETWLMERAMIMRILMLMLTNYC